MTRDLWTLAGSAIGAIISAYLLWTRAANASAYCPLGGGCDVVQSSRYAAVFGIPVALLGLFFYVALCALAAWRMDSTRRVAIALPIAAAGVASSVVFTIVQQVAIGVTCSLCLISAALTLFILVRLVLARPVRMGASVWAGATGAAVLAVAFLLGGYASSAPPSGDEAYAVGLARHLTASGAKFYGAYWCPHCSSQKQMFGKAAGLLPYIECAESRTSTRSVCVTAGVRAYPTWDIGGRRFEGVLTLNQLSELSGYEPPPP